MLTCKVINTPEGKEKKRVRRIKRSGGRWHGGRVAVLSEEEQGRTH